MLKKFFLALALSAGLLSPAYSAGTISFSLSQQFDKYGKPLAGCKLNLYRAGTTSPQTAYQDVNLTIPSPGGSLLRCDAAGRLPQFYLADGYVKVVLSDKNGVGQAYPDGQGALDNILVIGPSSGGSGGASIDPTTILATGDVKQRYGTGALSGFVRLNGRSIGSATSGATERANADCQALFEYLWTTDANLSVSTGRGASANADWVANKNITLPDGRGRALANLDDMGGSAAGRLTATYFGATATTLGAVGGSESRSLSIANINSFTPTGTFSGAISGGNAAVPQQGNSGIGSPVTLAFSEGANNKSSTVLNVSVTGTASGNVSMSALGSGTAHAIASPMILITTYMKL